MSFSVLMSVYRQDNPEYLKMALKSIYEDQTLKPNEIVIVQDGPLTEKLDRVILDFCSKCKEIIKVVKLEKNGGLGNALRVGTKECSYEYIMRMDSDDISVPNRFEKQIAYMEKNPQIACLGTYIAEFNNSIFEEKRVRVVPKDNADIVKMAKHRNPMNHVSVCMRKDALEKCGGYEEVNLLEDYYLWLKMITEGCILENLPESLVFVRIGNGFHSKRGSKQRIIGWKFLQNYILKKGLINKFTAFFNMVYIHIFVYMPTGIKKIIYDKLLRK